MTFFPQTYKMPNKYFKLILGPISSGKTTELNRLANRYNSIGKTIVCLHASEDKEDMPIKRERFDFIESSRAVDELMSCLKMPSIINADIIMLDAIHLLEDSYEFITEIINKPGHQIAVIATACDSTLGRRSYSHIEKLISFADSVEKLRGICPFHGNGVIVPSVFTKYSNERKKDGDIYSVCRSHAIYDIKYLEKNPDEKKGHLELIMGSMFSGKTTEAMRRVNLYSSFGKKVMAINHEINKRYGSDVIHSHDKNELNNCYSLSDLFQIYEYLRKEYDESDVIFIEEVQFFQSAYDFIRNSVDIDKKIVIAVGLDGDYKREPFGETNRLVSFADDYVKLHALCSICCDGTPAPFTMRINKENANVVAVGGIDDYKGVCRKCFDINQNGDKSIDGIAMNLLERNFNKEQESSYY